MRDTEERMRIGFGQTSMSANTIRNAHPKINGREREREAILAKEKSIEPK